MSIETLLVSSGNGPGECEQAVGHMLSTLSRAAENLGINVDISERPGRYGPTSAIVILSGAGAKELAQEWTGVVLWRCQSAIRPRHRRKNWFIQVFSMEQAKGDISIDPASVEMTAIRAGGPGGQHQNKTSSAIRARWAAPNGDIYSVVVRDHRSQHQNRRVAIERLQALASADARDAEASRKGSARGLHHQLERGAPSRIFEGASFEPT